MIRKILLLSTAFVVLSASFASAQNAEITPYLGYRFGGNFTNKERSTSFDVHNSPAFGAIFDYKVHEFILAEFHWSHQGSTLELIQEDQQLETDISIDNFHGGFLFQGGARDLQPYFVATVGVTRFGIEGADSSTKFSLGIGGGMKGLVTERIGWRFEFRGFTTFTSIEDEYEICDVWGCVDVVSTGAVFWQAQILGGVTIAF